jgi:hypothetical protein
MKGVGAFFLGAAIVAGCGLFPQYDHDDDEAATATEPRACAARRIGLSESGASGRLSGNSASLPTCALDDDGRVTLEYDVTEACARPEPYRGCVVASHQDIARFIGGEGLFEVELCVEGELDGALNIWLQDRDYGADFDPALRLNLAMVDQGEPFTSGRRRKWFRADDIGTSSRCVASMPSEAGACSTATPAAAIANDSSAFQDAQIQLLAEWCDESKVTGEMGHVVVTLVSLTYFPADCLCSSDGQCAGRGVCQADYWTETACCRCDTACPGVCSDDVESPH